MNDVVCYLSSEKLLPTPETPENFNTSVLWIKCFLHYVVPKADDGEGEGEGDGDYGDNDGDGDDDEDFSLGSSA